MDIHSAFAIGEESGRFTGMAHVCFLSAFLPPLAPWQRAIAIVAAGILWYLGRKGKQEYIRAMDAKARQ